jgi:hypothetical protein
MMKPLYVILSATGDLMTITTNSVALWAWRDANSGEGGPFYQIFELKAKDVTLDKPEQLPVWLPDE